MTFEYVTENELKQIELIKEKIEQVKNKIQEPTLEQIITCMGHIEEYIRNNKKIVYGGIAIDQNLKNIKHTGIYNLKNNDKSDIPDIEFYSFEPIKDCVELCNYLYDKGIKMVRSSEAIHPYTYSIGLFNVQLCDISYISKNVYYNLPYNIINSIHYVTPEFILIDIYRQLSDPLNSYFRIEKIYNRCQILEKNFPIINSKTKCKFDKKYTKNEQLLNFIENNYIINNKDIIVIGDYLLNYYVKLCNFKEIIKIKYFEIFSFDLINDLKNIKKLLSNYIKDIEFIEYTTYFQFLGISVEVLYKKKIILLMHSNNKKCIPVQKLSHKPSIKYVLDSNELKWIQFCSFEQQLLYYYIILSKNFINKTKKIEQYKCKIQLLYSLKKDFFEKNKISIFINSPFKLFNINCKGLVKDPRVDRGYRIANFFKKKNMDFMKYRTNKNSKPDNDKQHSKPNDKQHSKPDDKQKSKPDDKQNSKPDNDKLGNIVVYSKEICKYCKLIVEYLNENKYKFKEIMIKESEKEAFFEKHIIKDKKTFPQIFINNNRIGGYLETKEFLESKLTENITQKREQGQQGQQPVLKKIFNMVSFTYQPYVRKQRPSEFDYYYPNISGNKVINEKYLKIINNI
jgi:glutaredoxin